MKRITISCALVFLCACGLIHAQVPQGFVDGIKIDIVDNRYFQSGNLVATDILKINLQLRYPQCAPLISKSNSYRTGRTVAYGAGALFMIGGLSTMITGMSLENPYAAQYLYTASAINYLVATGCYLVSIPLHRNSAKSLAGAVQIYNQVLQDSGKSPPPATEKPAVTTSQTIAAAAAAAEPALPESPPLITAVPEKTITINGDYSDWQGLLPAFVDAKGDCNREFPGLDIKEIYLAKDLKNLYVRFVLFDEGFPAYPSVNMSAEVQLELGNADFLNLAIRYNKVWRSQLEIYNSSYKQLYTLAQGVLKRGGTGCEASFPIAAFYKRVQAGKEYRTIGQIWMSSNRGQLDNAGESRLLTF